jgi:hypothetical protein
MRLALEAVSLFGFPFGTAILLALVSDWAGKRCPVWRQSAVFS